VVCDTQNGMPASTPFAMTPKAGHQHTFRDEYQCVVQEAAYRACCIRGAIFDGAEMVELTLQHLIELPHRRRSDIVTNKPHIDIYLGNVRVFKRTSRTLLFAFCPDIGRFLKPTHGSLAIRLPHGHSNALAVKLAVLYMERYLIDTGVRNAPWRVRGPIASYIYLAELFAFIGMSQAALDLEKAILCRLQEHPLRIDQILAIWGRENKLNPSKWVYAMADNIMTFLCVPKIEHFRVEYDIELEETYEERLEKRLQHTTDCYPETDE
jgi:hypothetical protein